MIRLLALSAVFITAFIDPMAALWLAVVLLVLFLVGRRVEMRRERYVLGGEGFKPPSRDMIEKDRPPVQERPFTQLEIKEKQANLDKVLAFAQARGEVTNLDVRELINVPDSVAERYLCELEREQKLLLAGREHEVLTYVPRVRES